MLGRYERGRKIPWPLKMLGALIIIPGLLLLGTWVTMLLWNALIPAIFGIGIITFWQAMGIIVLAKILFGGPHGRPGGFPRRPRYKDREDWKQHMREKFAEDNFGGRGPHGRPGGFGPRDRWEADEEVKTDSETGDRENREERDS